MATSTKIANLQANQQPKLYAVFSVFLCIPIMAVALRLLSRRMMRTSLWWDDYLVLIATLLVIINFAFLIECIRNGAGRHLAAIQDAEQNLRDFLIYTYGNEVVYAAIVTCIKSSILCMYLRIFSINRRFAKIIYACLAFVTCWGIAVLVSTLFQCIPVQAAWNRTMPGAHCLNYRDWLIGTNVPNIIIDGCIFVLPIPLVWSLKLSLARRISLSGVFLLGTFTIACSIARVTFNSHIENDDATWSFVNTMIWSTIEGNIGVTIACLPVLAPIFRPCLDKKTSAALKRNSYKNAAGSGSKRDHALDFERLSEDEAKLFPIRKTVVVETSKDEDMEMNVFDARRPGDDGETYAR